MVNLMWVVILTILISFIVVGYFLIKESEKRKKLEKVRDMLEWIILILGILGLVVIYLFKEEFMLLFTSSQVVVAITVIYLILIIFPAITIASIGLLLGDILRKIVRSN